MHSGKNIDIYTLFFIFFVSPEVFFIQFVFYSMLFESEEFQII